MMKVRKKLFTLSGLFMILAQVFVAAFCGITAIAVTQEETTQSLYSNEYGSAAMSYELLENDRIKWTLTLAKTDQQTATQFMVDLAVDGNPLVPENVMSEGISLTGASSNGHIQAGLSEAASTMGGSGTVTFETAREIGTLTATPQLITSVEVPVETSVAAMVAEVTTETPGEETEAVQPAEEPPVQTETVVTNLLDGVGQTTFAIPDVEVVEEIDPEEPTDPNMPENDGGEVTGTDVVEGEEPGEVTENAGNGEVGNADSATEEIKSQLPNITQNIATKRSTNEAETKPLYTSLRFEKTWAADYSSIPDSDKKIKLEIYQKVKGAPDTTYEFYRGPIDFEWPTTVMEWHNLPATSDDGKTAYEYTVMEVKNDSWEIIDSGSTKSTINSMNFVTSNNSTVWRGENPSYFIASKGGGEWLIWTADHLETKEDRELFVQKIKDYGNSLPNSDVSQPFKWFNSVTDFTPKEGYMQWVEGSITNGNLGLEITVKVTDTEFTVNAEFAGGKDGWTHFMFGGNSAHRVNITNKYIPKNNITVEKIWDDRENAYNTREDIRLELQRYNASLPGDTEDDKWEAVAAHDIGKGATASALLQKTFTVPSKVNGETARYRVVEFVKNLDGSYVKRNVEGYEDPVYSNPREITSSGTLTVTNTLIEYDIMVRKIWNDGANEGNTRKNIQLILEQSLDDGTTWTEWTKYSIDNDAEETELSHQFTVPAAVGGKSAKYRVIEKVQQAGETDQYTGDRVPGYATPVYSNPGGTSEDDTLTVTNTLLAMGLNFTKVGNDGKTALSGVKFTITGTTAGGNPYSAEVTSQDITGAIGQVAFTDLQEGSYTLSETAPVGYESAGPWTFDVVYEAGELSIDWGEGITPPIQDGKLVNKLKKFDLTVNKKDDLGNALEGATFTLTGPEGFTTQVLPPNVNSPKVSTFTFTGLEPGEYKLTETNAPDGYTLLSGKITITISDTGQVQVTGNNISEIDSDLTEGSVNNTITFSVTNKKKVPLPATGGSGTMMFVTIGVLALTATGLYFLKRKDQEVA
ncbi:SpaA isopeptide-forming pilin-related protein [Enterococcus asini]|uniref:SpaA isopeptide-forming pilin-related protein n=1 Tax=Enterococcus asini TaxID=57732 RepID=UPI00266BA71D|nr:SpaA isopeptide-forming pilin-related protein [Enterococcus asini]